MSSQWVLLYYYYYYETYFVGMCHFCIWFFLIKDIASFPCFFLFLFFFWGAGGHFVFNFIFLITSLHGSVEVLEASCSFALNLLVLVSGGSQALPSIHSVHTFCLVKCIFQRTWWPCFFLHLHHMCVCVRDLLARLQMKPDTRLYLCDGLHSAAFSVSDESKKKKSSEKEECKR